MRYLGLYLTYQVIFTLIFGVILFELISNNIDKNIKAMNEMTESIDNTKKSSESKAGKFLLILGFFIPIINFFYLFMALTAITYVKDYREIKEGNTILLNNEKYIKNRQLFDIFKINDEHLKSSDKLVIYESYLDVFKFNLNYKLDLMDYKDIFIEKNEGWYDETNNVIVIFVFNLDSYKSKNTTNVKEEIIKTLLYELKHKYNTENNIVFNDEDAENKDCDNFVNKIFNENDSIIMNIIH